MPYRGPLPTVLQAVSHAMPLAVSQPPCRDTKLYRDTEAHATHSTARVAALMRHIATRVACCVATQGPPSCHDTKFCISTPLWLGRACARAAARPCTQAGRVTVPSWPCRSPAAHPQHAPALPYRALAHAQPCCVTIKSHVS